MSDADNMRKYMKLLTESNTVLEPKVIAEAKPVSFWQQLMTKANVLDGGRNARVDTGKIANEEYSEWKQYLGSIHAKENDGTIGDIKKFFSSRGFPDNVVQKALAPFTNQTNANPNVDINTIRIRDPQKVAKIFLQVVINTRKEIGHEGGISDFGSRAPGLRNTQQQKQSEPQQNQSAPQQQQSEPQQKAAGLAPLNKQQVLQVIQKLSPNDQKALAVQLANIVGTPVGGAQ
jgi:hypothetical protein